METMESSTAKCESQGLKRKKDKENVDPETPQCLSSTDRPSALSGSPKVEDIDTMTKDLSNQVNLLFSNYSKTLSERSALDSLHVQRFDDILTEATSLESQIREKKENLRSYLTMIAKTLQR